MSEQTEGLTGRRRFRQTRVDYPDEPDYQLVLQVEYTKFTMKGWKCYWRDATYNDITSAEEVV